MTDVYFSAILSILSFLLPVILIILTRRLLSKSYTYYNMINESICTGLWLLWSFEIHAVTIYTNQIVHSLVLFTALNILPYTLDGAFANPCSAVLKYFQKKLTQRNLQLMLVSQLVAIPISIVTIKIIWNMLSIFSLPHKDVYKEGDYLTVSMLGGFLCEAIAIFIGMIPSILVSNKTALNVANALTMVILELIFGNLSGSFCNPLPITTFSIFYSRQSWIELIIVYWCGNITGTILAWKLLMEPRYNRKTTILNPY